MIIIIFIVVPGWLLLQASAVEHAVSISISIDFPRVEILVELGGTAEHSVHGHHIANIPVLQILIEVVLAIE